MALYDKNGRKVDESKDFYSPDKAINKDDLLEYVQDGLFRIGQIYEDQPAETAICKKCKGKEFNIGSGSYYTAIRCTKCGWQYCLHEG